MRCVKLQSLIMYSGEQLGHSGSARKHCHCDALRVHFLDELLHKCSDRRKQTNRCFPMRFVLL